MKRTFNQTGRPCLFIRIEKERLPAPFQKKAAHKTYIHVYQRSFIYIVDAYVIHTVCDSTPPKRRKKKHS